MMEYKKQYSHEELEEILNWFEKNMDKLPASLQLNKATYIKDLPKTVHQYFDLIKQQKDNPTYSGQIHHLFEMRDAVLQIIND